jgi:hypothetical protein
MLPIVSENEGQQTGFLLIANTKILCDHVLDDRMESLHSLCCGFEIPTETEPAIAEETTVARLSVIPSLWLCVSITCVCAPECKLSRHAAKARKQVEGTTRAIEVSFLFVSNN